MSPLGLSVAQCRAQLAEQTVELALSGIERVAEATRCARGIVEVAIAEAISVHSQVDSRVASLVAHAKASTAHAISTLSKHVKEVAAHMEEQTSRAVGTIAQQLEKEIEAVAVSTVMMSEKHMRSAVDGLRNEVKLHRHQNHANFEK